MTRTTGSLTFGELMTTLMGCIGPQGDFETVLFAALQGPLHVSAGGRMAAVASSSRGRRARIVLAPAARDLTGG